MMQQISHRLKRSILLANSSQKTPKYASKLLPFFTSNKGLLLLVDDLSHRCYRHKQRHSKQQYRTFSSSSLPDPTTTTSSSAFTIWGGAGFLISTLHMNGVVPYWACMSLSCMLLRTCILPLVINGAHTQAKFAAVAPDVQFVLTLFQQDRQMMQMDQRNFDSSKKAEMMQLKAQHFRATWRNLRYVYKTNNVHPLDIFKAPLLQIPFFFYFASDLHRIIRGVDSTTIELARSLQDGGALWFMDLTEPDPYFVLPILTGSLMYLNVELATGRHSLSGATTSKANFAKSMKDFFQSISIFLPCFMSNSPAGVQIYLVTTFIFTLGQSAALRNDTIRQAIGLPSLNTSPMEPVFASKFIKFAKHNQQQQEHQDDVIGKGVLKSTILHSALPGSKRTSSIGVVLEDNSTTQSHDSTSSPFLSASTTANMPLISEEAMEAANRGDKKNFSILRRMPKTVIVADTDKVDKKEVPLSMKKLTSRGKRKT